MVTVSKLLVRAAVLANLVSGSNEADAQSGVLHVPLTRPGINERIALSRRADSGSMDLRNFRVAFAAYLRMGSNSQNVSVLVDTGSSDLWVMSLENPYCSSITENQENPFTASVSSKYVVHGLSNKATTRRDKIQCVRSTMFDPLTSTSFSKNQTAFSIEYGDNTFANGTYGQDDITFGGFTVKKANFAIADESDSNTSVLGIGLPGLEATVQSYDAAGAFSPIYSNLPMQLKEQGYIRSVAYSLWLNDKDASTGSLLFGGVDHSKYNGTLQSLPLLSSIQGAGPNEFRIKFDGISLYQGSQRARIVNCSYSALLDSGTTYTMLPQRLLNAVAYSIGGECTTSGCAANCGLDGGLIFDFSGVEITVPFSELLIPYGSGEQCIIGLLPAKQSYYEGYHIILGDTFLRAAYVVYDLERYEVALANTNLNGGPESVEAISTGIPRATKAPRYSNTEVQNSDNIEYASFFTIGSSFTPAGTTSTQTSRTRSRRDRSSPTTTGTEDSFAFTSSGADESSVAFTFASSSSSTADGTADSTSTTDEGSFLITRSSVSTDEVFDDSSSTFTPTRILPTRMASSGGSGTDFSESVVSRKHQMNAAPAGCQASSLTRLYLGIMSLLLYI